MSKYRYTKVIEQSDYFGEPARGIIEPGPFGMLTIALQVQRKGWFRTAWADLHRELFTPNRRLDGMSVETYVNFLLADFRNHAARERADEDELIEYLREGEL